MDESNYFNAEHYPEWTARRTEHIIRACGGPDFFAGKTVLDLGCGRGYVGRVFEELGADVTFVDGRAEHLRFIKKANPNAKVVESNLNKQWPFGNGEVFDIVLNLGLIYHIYNWESCVVNSCRAARRIMFLETEVIDSSGTAPLRRGESGFDQALDGVGTFPSPASVERFLSACEMSYERVGSELSTSVHKYDWEPKNDGARNNGWRAWWTCRPS